MSHAIDCDDIDMDLKRSHAVECDELIKMVSLNPILFDKTVRECFDPCAREDTWRIISEKLKCPVSALKKKWKGIRDSYVKSKKRQLRSKDTTSPDKLNFRGYKFFRDLEFLDPHLKSLENDLNHISIEPSDDQYTNDGSNSEFDGPVIEYMQNKGADIPINSSPSECHDSMPQIFMDSLNAAFQPSIGKCSLTTWQPAIGKCSIIQDPIQDIPDLWPESKQRKRKSDSNNFNKLNKHSEDEPKRSRLDDEDPNWCFLKSIHSQLNRLPNIKQSSIKIEILKLLHEAEFSDNALNQK